MMRKIERENTGLMKPGQDLVVAGFAGWAGTCEIVKIKREELKAWFSEDYLNEITGSIAEENRIDWASLGAAEWEPAGEGGILKAIWDLSGAYGTGVEFSLRDIPVRQATVEICERFELNPYRLYSGGCSLLAADNGGRLVEKLAGMQIPAKVIGKVNRGIAREMIVDDGRGFLERPQPDELNKVK